MDNGLIVPYLNVEEHEPLGKPEPLSGLRCKWVTPMTPGASQKSGAHRGKKSRVTVEACEPYRKPTQVDGLRIPR